MQQLLQEGLTQKSRWTVRAVAVTRRHKKKNNRVLLLRWSQVESGARTRRKDNHMETIT